MSTKLTLTIDDAVIHKAKQYAKVQGYSLSGMVENYLRIVVSETNKTNSDEELTPLVKSLMGSFTAPTDFDYKKELTKSISKKYL